MPEQEGDAISMAGKQSDCRDNPAARGGYRKMHTGEYVATAYWPAYCLAETGLRVADKSAPLAREAVAMLCEWVASGGWLRVEEE